MAGLINVPSTVTDPQLKVLLSQLRDSTLSLTTDSRNLKVRLATLEEDVIPSAENPAYVTVPVAPSAFRVTGLFQKIILDWSGGTTNNAQASVSHTEIWRSATNNRNVAVLRATSVADIWSDDVENGQGFYYWIRFINTAGVPSPWSGGINGGVFGQTVLNPADVIPVLSAKITTSELAVSLNARINLIDAPGSGLVTQVNQLASSVNGHTSSIQTLQSVTGGLDAQWSVKTQVNNLIGGIGFYNNGVTTKFFVNAAQFAVYNGSTPTAIAPFIIDSGGVYIDSAMIKNATITAAKIQNLAVEQLVGDKAAFVTANIADASITTAKIGSLIESTNYVAGVSGWRITKTGTAEFRNITARGDIEAQSLKASTAMVDTLHVNGFAITAPYYSSAAPASTISDGSSVSNESPMSVTMPAGSSGAMLIAVVTAGGISGDATLTVTITKNGSPLRSLSFTMFSASTSSATVTAFDSNPSGTNTYALTIAASVRSMTYWNSSLMCIGAKR